MGIKKANIFYKSFTYNGTLASDYGVYVLDVNVFDAPKRAVDYYAIPGRNGDFALDNGRFENIEVVYTCGIDQPTVADFNNAITSFKNLLASTKGYHRLEDGINTGFYRMGVFSDGLEVKTKNQKSATFDVKFNCKPQRWLTSGETASTVANNGTLSNPTLFESSPLLAVKGYGGIHFNGFDVDVQNVTLGDVTMVDEEYHNEPLSKSFVIDTDVVNNGDVVNLAFNIDDRLPILKNAQGKVAVINSSDPVYSNSDFSFNSINPDGTRFNLISSANCSIVVGTNQTITDTVTGTFTVKNITTNTTWTNTYSVTHTIQYVASSQTVTVSASGTMTTTLSGNTYQSQEYLKKATITANSSVSALGNPTYIDCDIGECYMIKNSNIVSLNGVIALGSQLPTLASGTNTFTYDNTITELKVTPRWWQV